MSQWRLATSRQFDRVARKLDKTNIRRVRSYLDEVAKLSDPRVRGTALTGNLVGYWRYRVGNFRILVEFDDESREIRCVALGHRREVYHG